MSAQNPLSMKSVAEETINAKLAQEHMDEMRQLIDMSLDMGHGKVLLQKEQDEYTK